MQDLQVLSSKAWGQSPDTHKMFSQNLGQSHMITMIILMLGTISFSFVPLIILGFFIYLLGR